jgi:hypothetical protein
MTAPVTKIVNRSLNVRHLLTHEDHVVVDVVELLIEATLNTLEPLTYALLDSPMLSSCDVLFIAVEDRRAIIT